MKTAEEIIFEASEETGWDTDSKLLITLQFIDAAMQRDNFARFMEDQVTHANNSTE